jgi:TRAP transporter TAXI family solute receptor
MLARRQVLLGLAGGALTGATARAQMAPLIVRIGTGGAAGTYFPIGRLIAEAISGPATLAPCADPAACGISGCAAVAQLSNGSVANAEGIEAGDLEAALVQSDVATWAHGGTGVFAGRPAMQALRFAANLYPESLHLVVRKEAGIRHVRELRGRRVSLDEPGSGTLLNARAVLAGYGLGEADLRPEYVKPDIAGERLRADRLDAFFIVAGWPTRAVADILASGDAALLPIGGPEPAAIHQRNPFLSPGTIPASAYAGMPETATLEVGAQLIVAASLPEGLVHALLAALWSPRATALLREGHARGSHILRERALQGRAIPFHPGAERWYRDAALLP